MPGIHSLGIQVSAAAYLFRVVSLLRVYVFGLLLSAGHSYFLTSSLLHFLPLFQFFLPRVFHSPYTVFSRRGPWTVDASTHRMMNRTTDYLSSTSLNLSSILGVTLTTAMIAVVVARLFIRTSDGRRSIRLVDWTHLLACVCKPPQTRFGPSDMVGPITNFNHL